MVQAVNALFGLPHELVPKAEQEESVYADSHQHQTPNNESHFAHLSPQSALPPAHRASYASHATLLLHPHPSIRYPESQDQDAVPPTRFLLVLQYKPDALHTQASLAMQ